MYLPNEILTHILDHLKPPLAPLASVNGQWQDIIESRLWADIKLTIRDLAEFKRFVGHHATRRRYLNTLNLELEDYFVHMIAEEWKNGQRTAITSHENAEEGHHRGSIDVQNNIQEEIQRISVDEITTSCRDTREDEETQHTCDEHDSGANIEARLSTFKNEHARFFQEIRSIWDELASWGDELKVNSITILVSGASVYELLGPKFRDRTLLQEYLPSDAWFHIHADLELPDLPSVSKLLVEDSDQNISIWLPMVACQVARTLPNITLLAIRGSDGERSWKHARRRFRQILGDELLALPRSLQIVHLPLEFGVNLNHEVNPAGLLAHGRDSLSQAIRCLSTNLTVLAINIAQISSELFWPGNPSLQECSLIIWPNLTVLTVTTGIETAAGEYSTRRADFSISPCPTEEYGSDTDLAILEEQAPPYIEYADLPYCQFRIRPEPEYFDALAVSIARAAARMPRLLAMTLHMTAANSYEGHDYAGWGFHFRNGNAGIKAYEKLPEPFMEEQIDWSILDLPRAEWVFQCPYVQLQWEEPEEATKLWRKKYPGIELDVVSYECDPVRKWERRREGVVIDLYTQKS